MGRRAFLSLILLGLLADRARAATETDELLPGRTIAIRTATSAKLTAKPPSGTRFALPSPPNRPTAGGGTLLLFDTGTGTGVMAITLPVQAAPLGWRPFGNPVSPSGFRYRAAGTAVDPCSVAVKATGVKVTCKRAGMTLAPPFTGDVGVVLSLGAGPKRYCASFGGVTVENSAGRLKRKNAPAPAECPTPPGGTTTTSTSSTTSSTSGQADADGDGVPDSLDRCPGSDDRIDLDRDGIPDACQELAVRSTIDSFDGYASDAALTAVWTQWPQGADLTVARGAGQGEGGTTSMRLSPIGPDPGTGNTWASVSRAITGPAASAYDGIVLYVRHVGATSLGLGMNLTEANGEPWAAANAPVSLRPDGGAWRATAPADANGVITLPAGFVGQLRIPFSVLRVPSWYVGPGDGVLDASILTNLAFGFAVTGHVGDQVHIDSVSWWYGIDPAIAGKIAGRTWPSIYQAWNGVDDEAGVNARDLIARHDLFWQAPSGFSFFWSATTLWEPCTPDPGGSCTGLSTAFTPASIPGGTAYVADLRSRNPNLLLLGEIRYRDAWATYLPAAHRFWQHDTQGNRIPGWAEGSFYLLDWYNPEYRALVAEQARVAVQAGLDGVFLDWWDDADDSRIDLVQRVRAAIGNRILIVNSNDRQAPRAAPFVNGIYMEGYQSATAQHWQQLGTTLAWAEAAVRVPRMNPIETWFATSRADADRMRATTTLSLTRSDGYALFCDPNDLPAPDHLHSWYPFWSEPLGTPLAPGALQPNGTWQREFTGGTVVYNPMGNPTATLNLPAPRRSATTGLVATTHTVAGRDGDLLMLVP